MSQGRPVSRIDLLVQSKERFLRFLERHLGNRADAEDLLQTAFLKCVTQGASLHEEEKLVPWFYQMLRNLIVDHQRHRSAVTRMVGAATEAAARTPTDDLELFRAVCACVQDVLVSLQPDQAELIRRVELEEESVSRVADDLRITPNNASVRLHRARHALRAALQDTCGACADHGCLDCGCQRAARQ